jgi:hypothetical protein
MDEQFPYYVTEVGSHAFDCDMKGKGCKNKRKFNETLCQECLYKEKFFKVFADINELQDTIQNKEEELYQSGTYEKHQKINKDIVILKEILEIFKQQISYDSDTVSDNRKIYKGTNEDGQQLILETHCTIVRVSNSPENVYFGHVTLEINYPDDIKYKWHYGIKTFDQLPENLYADYWQTFVQGQTQHNARSTKISKLGNFPNIPLYTTLLNMMKHHFIKCFDYFTTKSQWDKQIWYKKDVVGDEDANTVLERLKEENDTKQSVNFGFYQKKWSKFKETEQKRKQQERQQQERERKQRKRQEQERERRERQEQEQERERREQELLEKPKTEQFMNYIEDQRKKEDKKSREYRIEEQRRKKIVENLAQEKLNEENAKRKSKALEEETKKNENLRVLRQRAYEYRQKQNKRNEVKDKEDRREQEDSEYLQTHLEKSKKEQQIKTYLKDVENEEIEVLKIEEKLKEVDLMSSKAISYRKLLSKKYKETIENFNKNILIAENDEYLNTETKSTFLKILQEKLKDTEKRVHLLNQKELAYVLNIKIQKIEDHYKNVIAPTEKKLQTLKYEEGSIWRRFLINYYRTTYEDRNSEYKSIISKTRRDVSHEEYLYITDKLIKLDSLIKHRDRLEELCKLETPLIIDYYKLYDDDGNEDDEFIISQLFILHPSFFTEGMAKVFVDRARKENNGILSTKYFIKFFPENERSYNKALEIFREMMLKNLNKTK